MKWMFFLPLGAVVAAAVACDGDTVPVGTYEETDGAAAASSGSPDANAPDSRPSEGDEDDAAPSGPRVVVSVRAHGDPVAHDPATAGQMPKAQSLAIRSLTLLRSADDPDPYVVFDYGASSKEAGLEDGADTEVASVAASTLRAGSFTLARCGVAFVRYRVAATMHAFGQRAPGELQSLHVLSDAVQVDGARRDRGHFAFSFETPGMPPVAVQGDDAAIPQVPTGAGFTLDLGTPDAAYVFPVAVLVPQGVQSGYRVIFDLNTHENFRWTDERGDGYAEDVFDVTPASYETVTSFGANSFAISAEALP